MRAMLGPDHADRRQLCDLVATEPATPRALLHRELTSATTALLRIVIDDLIDLILRLELAPRTPMPGLAARLAPLTFLARQLLGLRPRFRPALLS
jgi:hypothetical protein